MATKYTTQELIHFYKDLCKEFPSLFSPSEIKLLKIGVHQDIIDSGKWPHSNFKLKRTMQFYCGSPEYKAKVILGANRYDLEGNISSQVKEKELHK